MALSVILARMYKNDLGERAIESWLEGLHK